MFNFVNTLLKRSNSQAAMTPQQQQQLQQTLNSVAAQQTVLSNEEFERAELEHVHSWRYVTARLIASLNFHKLDFFYY